MTMSDKLEQRCESVREKLSAQELGAQDALHLADCESCRSFAETLAELDAELLDLPVHQPSDELVTGVLSIVTAGHGAQSAQFEPQQARLAGRLHTALSYLKFSKRAVVITTLVVVLPFLFYSSAALCLTILAVGGALVIRAVIRSPKSASRSFSALKLLALLVALPLTLTAACASLAAWLAGSSAPAIVPMLFQLLEGSAGALLMLAALVGAILSVLFYKRIPPRWRLVYAPSFATAFVAIFMVRAMTSLFFGNFEAPLGESSFFNFGGVQQSFSRTSRALSVDGGGYFEPPAPPAKEAPFVMSDKKTTPEFNDLISAYKVNQDKLLQEREEKRAEKNYAERDADRNRPEEIVGGKFRGLERLKADDEGRVAAVTEKSKAERLIAKRQSDRPAPETPAEEVQVASVPRSSSEQKADRRKDSSRDVVQVFGSDRAYSFDRKPAASPAPAAVEEPVRPSGPLEHFLAERANLTGLRYKNQFGYWENTYLPGDPTFRRLHSEVLGTDFSTLESITGRSFRLDNKNAAQPFDVPQSSALALYLSTDKRAIEGPARVLLQVGIKAADRRAATRPPMRLAVVLDLQERSTLDVASEILQTLIKRKDFGDRFSLYTPNNLQTAAVSPENFKYGYIRSALEALRDSGLRQASVLPLLQNAVDEIFSETAPNSPLGSAAVLLISDRDYQRESSELLNILHKSAVTGAPVSLIGVGPKISRPQYTEMALAGHGSRRFVNTRDEAIAAADAELASVSAVVARAVRLKIRLGEGVKLVDVIGSRSLDQVAAARVKAAEKSIDQRVARSIGISADRGDDEDGIQIIIPAFYAGDSHVILIDVTAAKSGKLAEVTARYKDLVYLKNGVVRADAALERGSTEPGPLELNVLKNLLASQLAERLTEASELLGRRENSKAALILQTEVELRRELQQAIPLLSRDIELNEDIELLSGLTSVVQQLSYSPQDSKKIGLFLEYQGQKKISPALPLE